VVGVAAIPSVALWTWIGRRWGNDRSFALACLVEGLGVALSVLATSAFAIIASAVLLGGTFMGITALGLIHGRSLATGDPRRIIALMTAAFGFGQMIGPSFAGIAYDLTASFTAPTLTAAAALVIAAGLVGRHAGNRRLFR
jgi:predicted MFS family arabinose efflux permease